MSVIRRLGLAAVVVAALAVWPASGAMAAGPQQVPLSGTGSAQTGDFTPSGAGDVTQAEFPAGDNESGPDPYNGTISFSAGAGGGPSVSSGPKAKSNPVFNFGFEGLNHYQQRYSRGGNQFSVEPPDRQRRLQRLQRRDRSVAAPGQHRRQHRGRLPAER